MSIESIYQDLKTKLHDVVPDVELRLKSELAFEINKLKKERNAVILGHNYMEPALFYSIPDYVGDSLELSRIASKTEQDIIVFCGVRFMAETAKILSPQKTVLIPAKKAGCSLADGITAEDVRQLKSKFPGVPVVTYVNTSAEVKAESDICCTSSNAVAVVESLKSETVIFLPDEYLARNVAMETGRHIIFPTLTGGDTANETLLEKPIIGWKARCDVLVLAHPECSPEVVAASDYSGSTTQMIRHVQRTNAPRYLLLTECSMGDNIIAANPEKNMLRLCSIRCPHMNEITLEDTLEALRKTQYVVDVPEEIRVRAYRAVERMLKIIPKTSD